MFKTNREITSAIISVEQEEDLFNWEIGGIYIWEIIRYKIYLHAVDVHISSESGTASARQNLRKRIGKHTGKLSRLLNALIYHPFGDHRQTDVLLMESSRKTEFNGEYIDPYTHFTYLELIAGGKTVSRYQNSYSYDRLAKRQWSVKHTDAIDFLSSWRLKSNVVNLMPQDISRLAAISEKLINNIGIQLNVEAMVRNELSLFRLKQGYYGKILDRKKPKELYLVNSCDKPALIAAAKKRNIHVIDIQHGLISSDDIIYHFPNVKKGSLRYFADQFYAWSGIWSEICEIPLTPENILNHGNRFLEQKASGYTISKIPNRILIVSQPGLTAGVCELLTPFKEELQSFELLFKLHPNEYNSAARMKEVRDISAWPNVSFVGRDEDLYGLMASSPYVFGIYSTALLEALHFQCLVIVLPLPGTEMMAPFLETHKMEQLDISEFLLKVKKTEQTYE